MPEQTDTDTIYILSENAPAQIDNMVGLTDQINLPPGYSRTRPEPTPMQGVWRVQRTRRFNVVPLALSQANVLYDKTQASTTTLNAATGGELPLTYSLPLVRGSQDRFDVPGASVTFDPVDRELNIGSGFDEGLEVNYTARDACNQVANAQVLVRPSATEHDAFADVSNVSVSARLPAYSLGVGPGETASFTTTLNTAVGATGKIGLAPYTVAFQSTVWADNGWQVSVVRSTLNPLDLIVTVVMGDWFLSRDSTQRQTPIIATDFLGRTAQVGRLVAWYE